MNTEIKKYADSGDIKSLKYIFVDSLDVDPTFVQYEEEYNYCKSVPGLLEAHVELTPLKTDKADWNEEYWTSLKMDLVKNFSDRRMNHMREVAQIFLADKIQRILAERASHTSNRKKTDIKVEPVSSPAESPVYVKPEVTNHVNQIHPSKAVEQDRRLEEEKCKLKAENKIQEALIEHEARERTVRIEQQHREQEQAAVQTVGGFPKKAIGIAVAVAVAVLVIAVLAIAVLAIAALFRLLK